MTRSNADPLDPDLVVLRLLERRAQERPDHVLLVDAGRGQLSAGELHDSVLRWAAAYQRLGVEAEDSVAVMLPQGFDAVRAWLGLGWLRAREVPLNLAYRGRMLRYVLENSRAQVAVVSERFLDRLAEVAAGLPDLRAVVVPDASGPLPELPVPTLDRAAFLDGVERARNLVRPGPWDIASIVYTSGTTGPSKGVLMPWAELTTGIDTFDELGEGDVLYAPMPPFHLLGKVPVELAAFWGGTWVFREMFSTPDFWPDVRRHNCSHGWLVFTMVSFINGQPPQPDDADNPLRTMTMGPLWPDFARFQERFGIESVRTVYGMTEVGWPIVTGDHVADWRSCGRARPGFDLRIVDDHDREVPEGEIGELILRSETPWTMNAGYFGMPEKTAEAWRNGWFHTGDAFRKDAEGNYFFVDRIKDAIRRRGENISSFEVEALVLDHPDVMECAALGVPSEHGEEEIRVFVVPKPGRTLEPSALIAELLPRAPHFMVPRYVDVLEALPKTETNKVRKVELRDRPLGETTFDRERAGISVKR